MSDVLLQAVLTAINDRAESDRQMFEKMAEFQESLARMEAPLRDVAYVVKIVRDGNGERSLMARMRDVEAAIKSILKGERVDAEGKSRNWDRIVQIACTVLTVGGAIYVAFH